MTRFVAWNALGMIWSHARLIFKTSFPSVLLTLAAIMYYRLVLESQNVFWVRSYTTGLPQLVFQAVFMSFFAVGFFSHHLSHQKPALTASSFVGSVGGYMLRVLGLFSAIVIVWFVIMLLGFQFILNAEYTATWYSYVPIAVLLFASSTFGWLWLRFAIILPAYVVGQPLGLRVAWRASRSWKYQAVFLSIACYVVPWIALIMTASALQPHRLVEPAITILIIWFFAAFKITTLATMYDRMLSDRDRSMSDAFD